MTQQQGFKFLLIFWFVILGKQASSDTSDIPLHKKRNFPLGIFSVNVTKCAVFCDRPVFDTSRKICSKIQVPKL